VSQQQPSEEELRAALEEQMRHIRVEDVLLQTIVTLINLGARRLGLTGGDEQPQPDEARLAIEGARALAPLVPSEEAAPIRDALSQLQMAYVQSQGGQGRGERGEEAPPAEAPDDAAERAKARSKIWTPGS
jgi:hypothetical protein